jgi:hypothetical protein
VPITESAAKTRMATETDRLVGIARLREAGVAEDQLARELLLVKYSGSEEDLDGWGRTSLAVVVAFPADAS